MKKFLLLLIFNVALCAFHSTAQTFTLDVTASMQGNGYSISCNGADDGVVTLTFINGVGPYALYGRPDENSSYQLFEAAIDTTVFIHDHAEAGTYYLMTIDSNGDTAYANATVTQPGALEVTLNSASFSGYNIHCNGGNDGEITANVAGGTTPYSYLWSNDSISISINGLGAGEYTVIVTDAGGCSDTVSKTLTEPDVLTSSISSPANSFGYNVACAGAETGSVELNVSGGVNTPVHPYTYNWNTGPFTQDVENLSTGFYSVQIEDGNGCFKYDSITLTAPLAVELTVTKNTFSNGANTSCVTCNDASVILSAIGGTGSYSYAFRLNNEAIASLSSDTLGNMSADATHSYYFYVTDEAGCIDSAGVSLSKPAPTDYPLSINLSPKTYIGNYNISQHGAADGSIKTKVTGGAAPYSYQWSTGDTLNNLADLTAGTYHLTVTDAANNIARDTIALTEPSGELEVYLLATQKGCLATSTSKIESYVIGGTPPYEYHWSGGGNSLSNYQTLNNPDAGDYTLLIVDANEDSVTAETTINEFVPLNVGVSADSNAYGYNVTCFGGNDGNINLSVSGGTAPYTFWWNDGATIEDRTGLQPGVYSVSVTDSIGCTKNAGITLTAPSKLGMDANPFVYGNHHFFSCDTCNDGHVTVYPFGGVPPYTFLWHTGASSPTLDNIYADSLLHILITDAAGCVFQDSGSLPRSATWNDSLMMNGYANIFPGTGNVSCDTCTDGSITINVAGGNPPYSFAWNNGATTKNLSAIGVGFYTITITDNSGQQITQSFNLYYNSPPPPPPPLVFSFVARTYIGNYNISQHGGANGSIYSKVSGGVWPYTYLWNTGDTFYKLQNLTTGTYTLTVTDAAGVTFTDSIFLNEPSGALEVFLLTKQKGCYAADVARIESYVIGGTPPYEYQWSQDGITLSNYQTLNNPDAGAYSLLVTDANQDSVTVGDTINSNVPMSISLSSDTNTYGYNVTCFGVEDGNIDLTVTGGVAPYTYWWNDGVTTEDRTGLKADYYSVEVKDSKGCSQNAGLSLTAPPKLGMHANMFAYENNHFFSCDTCNDAQITIEPYGGIPPYSLLSSTGETEATLSNLYADSMLFITITDAAGCVFRDSGSISRTSLAVQPLSVNVDKSQFQGGNNVSCSMCGDGWINLNIYGGHSPYSFYWTDPHNMAGNTSQNRSMLSAGTYKVRVTDSHGDSAIVNISMVAPITPLTTMIYNMSNNCGATASAYLYSNTNGGTPPYEYQWKRNGDTLSNPWSSLSTTEAGNYELLVIDANTDSAFASYTLSEPGPQIHAVIRPILYEGGTIYSCDTCGDGRFYAQVSGGIPPYYYYWYVYSDSTAHYYSTDSISGVAPGPMTYCYVWVSDSRGCGASHSIYPKDNQLPSPLSANYNASNYPGGNNVSCFNCNDGWVNVYANGGMGPYNFYWNDGYTGQNRSMMSAGEYHVWVVDMYGDSVDINIKLLAPSNELVVSVSHMGNNCYGSVSDWVYANTTGGTPPYQYFWKKDGDTLADHWQNRYVNEVGNYEVLVIDANSDSATTSFIEEQPGPQLNVTTQALFYENGSVFSCENCNDGRLYGQVSGGTPPYTYSWSHYHDSTTTYYSTDTISGLGLDSNPVYYLNVTDTRGCSAFSSNWLNNNTPPTPISINYSASNYPGGFNVSCYNCADGWVSLSAMGGKGSYSFTWNDGYNGQYRTMMSAGDYHVRVTDMYGDSASVDFSLLAPSNEMSLQLTSNVNGGCNGGSLNANISAMVNGGTPPYTYQWSGPSGTLPDMWQTIFISQQGMYYLTVTDANQSTVQGSVNIIPPPSLTVHAEAVEQHGNAHTGCTVHDGRLLIHLQGGRGPYNVNVNGNLKRNNNNNNNTPTPAVMGYSRYFNTSDTLITLDSLEAGNYWVQVSDMTGCWNGSNVEVREAEQPHARIDGTEYENGYYFSCDTCHDAQMTAAVTGGNGNLQYHWFEIPAENANINLKGASFFMAENKDWTPNNLPPAVSTSQTANITNAETMYGLVVADELGCVGFTNFTLEKPKPSSAWQLKGNTADTTFFLGTLDDSDLRIGTNDTVRVLVRADGNVEVKDTLIAENLKVTGKVMLDSLKVNYIQAGRITTLPGDSILVFGDSSTVMLPNYGKIFNDEIGNFKGIALGKGQSNTGTLAWGRNSTAIGYNVRTYPTAINSVVIGSSSGIGHMLKNETPNTLMVGFNSNMPTLFVGPSAGEWTTGKVGVGTATPWMKFQVDAGADNGLLVRTNHAEGWGIGLDVDVTHDQTRAIIVNKQNSSGELRTNFLVWGSGDVWAREFHVTLDDFYDYVFDEDYQLMPLPELEQYLIKHKHLPDIPSAAEIKEDGMSMAEMEALLVKKVEELTLYVIQLNKENAELNKKVEELMNTK